MRSNLVCTAALLLGFAAPLLAQENQNPPTDQSVTNQPSGIQMIAHTTQAVDYRNGAKTGVDFKGTVLLPELTGKAKVSSKRGLTDVRVEVEHLRPARSLELT